MQANTTIDGVHLEADVRFKTKVTYPVTREELRLFLGEVLCEYPIGDVVHQSLSNINVALSGTEGRHVLVAVSSERWNTEEIEATLLVQGADAHAALIAALDEHSRGRVVQLLAMLRARCEQRNPAIT